MAEKREESIRLVDEARAVFTDWQESNRACDRLKDEIVKQEMELTREKSSLEERADAEIRRKRLELEDRYDRQAEKLANERKRILANRDKAKKKGVKERVAAETEGQKRDISIESKALVDLFRNNKVPRFCSRSLFYTLFSPRRFTEILGAVCGLLICFGAIPLGIYYFLMNHTNFYLAIVYAADLFVFGGLYLLIRHATIGKHADVIKEGRQRRNNIHEAKKQIRKIEKQIRKDKDESHYELGDFDLKLTRLSEEHTDLLADKRQALIVFDTETVESIRQQFAGDNREKFQRMEDALAAARAEEEKQRGIAAAASAELDSRFVPALGEELISQEGLESLRKALEEGAWDIESARRALLGTDEVPFGEEKGSEETAAFGEPEAAGGVEVFDEPQGLGEDESFDQAEVDTMDDILPMDQHAAGQTADETDDGEPDA